nr:MAG TPA: hypothetical protein [Caudoviricetes sp.]
MFVTVVNESDSKVFAVFEAHPVFNDMIVHRICKEIDAHQSIQEIVSHNMHSVEIQIRREQVPWYGGHSMLSPILAEAYLIVCDETFKCTYKEPDKGPRIEIEVVEE